ncbi:MAG: leucine--tRNA ligase [Dehalococcoidia bacterium]|nr:leucine--tRNA ligase [Dehalococcoidia bacterium]
MIDKYIPAEIEPRWQARWEADRLYEMRSDDSRPKWYALTMFPYTSGDLHIGHWYAMAPSDVFARFKRMQGFNVLHPMGFDAFGLPAENAAIKHGVHPYTWTMKNVENMRRQLKSIGAVYDWSREVVTCLPEYYKWTQWFFIKLWEAGLAYRAKAPVNWCPACKAVLANEQVVDGSCWRCEAPVARRDLEQWFFRITRYADELMRHDHLDWPERIKTMQANWVGRSEGTEIAFALESGDSNTSGNPGEIKVFTTRPDTAYGVTFMVLAPEHPLVASITAPDRRTAIDEYIRQVRMRTEIERLSVDKEKDGVFTGAYATNRLNDERVPVFIADYVLLSYGTGAVMGVPAHDERDFAFAKRYNLPMKVVIAPPNWQEEEALSGAYTGPGRMVNSGMFNGTINTDGARDITKHLEAQGWGCPSISYKLRDWLISRQRYWGAPIPMIYCKQCGLQPVPERDLPVLLPEDAEFRPGGDSPLTYHKVFLKTTCPNCGGQAQRETDTMDTFMCSSWYFLRYCSPHCSEAAYDSRQVQQWMPIDIYTGGADHAVMHLFYARFFVKALRDMGLLSFNEPFLRLFNQGVITCQHQKMSKSKGNVVNPDDYVQMLGADTVRAYIMFVGPWEQGGDWDDSGISGLSRFLNRVWTLALEPYKIKNWDEAAERALQRTTHQTIRRVSGDMERLHFNTMLAALMEYASQLNKARETGGISEHLWNESVQALLLMIAPTAPHLAEELWARRGLPYSIHSQSWPKWDEVLAQAETIPLLIQVSGKLRDKLLVAPDIAEDEARTMAMASAKVQAHTSGKEIVQCIYVPGRLINLVVRP